MKTTKARAYELISPVIDFVYKHEKKPDRAKARKIIEKEIKKRTGEVFRRQQIDRWITTDYDKFTEPRLGIGMVLIEIEKDLSQGIGTPKKKEVPCKPKTKISRSKITR